MNCPKCNEQCDRDEADVGVGVIYGPYGCGYCGWRYDRSNGTSAAQLANPDYYVDQFGGLQSIEGIVDHAERFGFNR